jgi:formylglycine-generating enzyme required for sulfatase activity
VVTSKSVLIGLLLSGCLAIPDASRDNPCDPGYAGALSCPGPGPRPGADVGADALPPADAADAAPDTGPVPPDASPDAGPPDQDGDGVPDATDDCPGTPDPQQADRDGDGAGDACDPCPDGGDAVDADGDGRLACNECDDTDPHAFPGAVETCNGKDDDCDGQIDEGGVCLRCEVASNVGGRGLDLELCTIVDLDETRTFWMGCRDDHPGERCPPDGREAPQHRVTDEAPYRLTRREITVGQYQACVNAGGPGCVAADRCDLDGHPNYGRVGVNGQPVVCVDRNMAAAFCSWIGGTLPSEADWELAARGPMADADAYHIYPWGDDTPDCHRARSAACSPGALSNAGLTGSAGQSPFGLYDMAGNAAEWVADCSHPDYTGAPADGSAWTFGCDGVGGVTRGGSYLDGADRIRVAYRRPVQPSARLEYVGFRCRIPIVPQQQ